MNAPLISLGRATLAGGLALAACSLAVAPPAQATAVFAIAPTTKTASGYFVLASTPGAVLKRRIKVTNVGDSAGVARLYPVDATTGRTTGAVYLGADRPRLGVGAWITLQQAGVRLDPRQSKTIVFTLRVPKQVRGGQHLGGIVADNVSLTKGKPKKKADGSFKIDLHHLTITAVQVDLPGKPASSMAIGGLRADGRPGYQNVLVDMASNGNQLIKPTLTIDVKDGSGKKVLAKATKLDTILPSTRIDYPVAVVGRGLAAGTYKGTVVLTLGGKILARFSGSFDVTDKQVAHVFGSKAGPGAPGGRRLPWKTILAGALALLLAAAAAFGIRSVRRRRAAAAARARLDLEAAASRLRHLEDRESSVAESERIDTVRKQLLEERGRDLDDLEQASADRAREMERIERVLGEREAEANARGQDIELSQVRLTEREQAAAVRAQELEHSHLLLVERAAEEAARRQELHDGERRLRDREEEADARHHQRGVHEAAGRQALLDGEQRLREREDAHSRLQQSMTSRRRDGNTLASRLKRRIGA